MPPSCFSRTPEGVHENTPFAFMINCEAVPNAFLPRADPQQVRIVAQQVAESQIIPLQRAEDVASALLQGIGAVLALARRGHRN